MKKSKLLWLIIGIIGVSIFIFILSSYLTTTITESIKLASDIVRTVATIITLIIAVALFDKYGLRKVVVERQINVVVELIEYLRKTSFTIQSEEVRYIVWFTNDMNVYKKNPFYEIDKKKNILFKHGASIMVPSGINDALNNLWTPSLIKDKLRFLEFRMASIIPLEEKDRKKYMIVEFESKNQEVYFLKEEQTFDEFLSKINLLMESLKKWIETHADIKELNYTPTSEKEK